MSFAILRSCSLLLPSGVPFVPKSMSMCRFSCEYWKLSKKQSPNPTWYVRIVTVEGLEDVVMFVPVLPREILAAHHPRPMHVREPPRFSLSSLEKPALPEVVETRSLPICVQHPSAHVVFELSIITEYQRAAAIERHRCLGRHAIRTPDFKAPQISCHEIEDLHVLGDRLLE